MDDEVHNSMEFLNILNPPGLPAYRFLLKPEALVLLLGNLRPIKLYIGISSRLLYSLAVLINDLKKDSFFHTQFSVSNVVYKEGFK